MACQCRNSLLAWRSSWCFRLRLRSLLAHSHVLRLYSWFFTRSEPRSSNIAIGQCQAWISSTKWRAFTRTSALWEVSCCCILPVRGNTRSMHCAASPRRDACAGRTKRHRMRSTMMDLLFAGVGWTGIAMTLNRIAVGAFFVLSGYHKLFNAERHRTIVNELKALGVPALGFNQWWVPLIEFSAGAPVLVGLLAALGLLVIIVVAIATSGHQRMKLYKPIDEADRLDDFLYLPEVLYAFMLIMVLSAGAGPYSFDALILRMIDHAA